MSSGLRNSNRCGVCLQPWKLNAEVAKHCLFGGVVGVDALVVTRDALRWGV